jgi:hypothetical protein
MSLVASCHCGATQIELPRHPTEGTECNCTYCSRTGAVWSYYSPGELKFVAHDSERMYSTSPQVHQHYFCGTCGMQTWGSSPDWSTLYNDDGTPKDGGDGTAVPTVHKQAVNLRLVDGLDWSRIEIAKLDGRNSW